MDTNILHDTYVLVTRPQELADNLCALIKQHGGTPIRYPAIEIHEPKDVNSREFVIDNIHAFDMAVFISPTAVQRTLQYLPTVPQGMLVAAIGSRTAETLIQAGINTDIVPEGHDSESLLAHPDMQSNVIHGLKIIIFRGEGGRNLLGDTLSSRGANVIYAEMYRRGKPGPDAESELKLQRADIVAISSNEGLLNLLDRVSDKACLRALPLIVPGVRCENMARTVGFEDIIVAENATDNATMEALTAWVARKNGKRAGT